MTPANKRNKDQRIALLEFINVNKLAGSPNNKVTVVFDGYPDNELAGNNFYGINVVFSKGASADERIKSMLERCQGAKGIVVVSNDKEIKFSARSLGAAVLKVEEFVEKKNKRQTACLNSQPELTHTQMHKINTELKKLWLGE